MSEKLRVTVAQAAFDFVRRQAPEARRSLRLAIRGLESERGDIKPLEGELAGLYRLRVGAHRVIFFYKIEPRGKRTNVCAFAEHRSVVYLMLNEMLRAGLIARDKPET